MKDHQELHRQAEVFRKYERMSAMDLVLRLDKAEAERDALAAQVESVEYQQREARDYAIAAMKDACDLLAERRHGSPARSPGHNARLLLEGAVQRLSRHKSETA